MKRRDFIISVSAACLLGSMPFSGCIHYKPITAEEDNGKLKINKSNFLQHNWVVVKSTKVSAPIFLSRERNETYNAVLMLCTHKQCQVKPLGSTLVCPCHGSEFSFNGRVMKEPADKDLVQYEVSSDETTIYIHIQ